LLRLQKIYKHPDDVDLFPGLLSETRLPGAVTGPTLSCLIGLQFSHIRQADNIIF
jgi:peroxidase